jgi:hypothetical protein
MDHLEDRYDDMSEDHAIRWVQTIRAQGNDTIRRRFTMPEGTEEEIRAALADLKQDALRDLAAAEGLTLSGSNENLRARLLGAEFEGDGEEQTEEEQVAGEPTDEQVTEANAAQVEVTGQDGTPETVTGTLPASAEQPATVGQEPAPVTTGQDVAPVTTETPAPTPTRSTARNRAR